MHTPEHFVQYARLGKNEWWRYVITLLLTVAVIVLANLAAQALVPLLKASLPAGDTAKDLGTFALILLVLGSALLTFLWLFRWLHRRPIFSLISTDGRFDLWLYLKGFGLWGLLLSLGIAIDPADKTRMVLDQMEPLSLALVGGVGIVALGVQSFFEEILIRAYWLQGLHLRVHRRIPLILINGLLFGLLHAGYGIESFVSSWIFGIAFAVVVLKQERIELVSGAHNANNWLLALFFLDLDQATQESFSWDIHWLDLGLHLLLCCLFVAAVFKFFRS